MLAHQAVARGYAKGPRTLLWASSEGGQRAAALLEASVPLDQSKRLRSGNER